VIKATENTPEIENTKKIKFGFIYRIFCWCSGARLYILKNCPTDYNTFFGIGIVIFLTGIMATISGSYAFYTIFNIEWLSLAFGLFWGTLIFFLDWYLVSSLKKQNNKKKEFLLSFPRFIFAIFLAVVISKPIELKLFEKEINEKIASIQQSNKLKSNNLVNREFEEIEKLSKENEKMAFQIKEKEMMRNKLFQLVIDEAEGKSGTGIMGKGPVYKDKKDALSNAEKELGRLQENLLPLMKKNSERIAKLQDKKDATIELRTEVTQQSNGFLARIEAMGRLSKSSTRINIISWFIIFLFIAIESAPIFVKLISARGAYDEMLDTELYKKQLEAKRIMAHIKNKENTMHRLELEKAQNHFNLALENDKDFTNNIKLAQNELNTLLLEKWKKKEIEDIEENFEKYSQKIKDIVEGKYNKIEASTLNSGAQNINESIK